MLGLESKQPPAFGDKIVALIEQRVDAMHPYGEPCRPGKFDSRQLETAALLQGSSMLFGVAPRASYKLFMMADFPKPLAPWITSFCESRVRAMLSFRPATITLGIAGLAQFSKDLAKFQRVVACSIMPDFLVHGYLFARNVCSYIPSTASLETGLASILFLD